MKLTKRLNIFILIFIFACSILSLGIYLPTKEETNIYASAEYSEQISLTNSDFNSSPNSTTLDQSPSGWTKKNSNSRALSGIINVESDAFKNNASSYDLENTANPGKMHSNYDNKVLMLNATKNGPSTQGFASNNISLQSYSYYEVSVLLKTQSDAKASIYLKGLDNESNETYFEETSSLNVWREYSFFVETFINAETIQLEVWLGTEDGISSPGVAYFDHIVVRKYSKTLWDNEYPGAAHPYSKQYSNESRYITSVDNAYFDDRNITSSWKSVNGIPTGAIAKVVETSSATELVAAGFKGIGVLPTSEGTKALALGWKGGNTNKKAFGVQSSNFEILSNGYYKVSVSVKVQDIVGGSAYVKLVENDDILYFYGSDREDIMDFYTLSTTASSGINSNSGDKFLNDYQTVSFFVKGHPLFNTKMHLELWLGEASTPISSGLAVFDNITIERLTSEEYSNFNKSSLDVDVALTTLSGTPSIANGNFNIVSEIKFDALTLSGEASKELITPASFTLSSENELDSVVGIANTHSAYYSRYQPMFGIANPGNPVGGIETADIDVNNILMMWNTRKTYQSISTESFNVEANSFYRFSFDFKTPSSNVLSPSKIELVLKDSNGIEIYKNSNISSSFWKKFDIVVKTFTSSSNITATINFGTSDEKVIGWAMLDNLSLSKVNEAAFNLATESTDLTNYMFNLVETTDRFIDSPAFSGSSSTTGVNAGESGIFDGNFNIYGIEHNNNVLGIINNTTGVYSLTSKFSFPVEADRYYKFSFLVKTFISEIQDDEDELVYGAGLELIGIENYFKEIRTPENEGLKEYSMFIKSGSAADLKLRMFVQSANFETIGAAYFADIKFETVTETDYNDAKNSVNPRVMATETTTIETEEPEEDPTEDPEINFDWLTIPSIIFGLAIVVAILGYFVRHIKIRRFERKDKSSYDRTKTVDREFVRMEAERRKTEELNVLKTDLESLKTEIEELEKSHKEYLTSQRESKKNKGLSTDKEAEKAFKSYASKHTKLQESIDSINTKINDVESPEYVVKLQKKIDSENLKRKNQLKEKSLEDFRKKQIEDRNNK